MKNLSLRLTSQLSPKNKLTAYVDRVSKEISHDMLAGYDPATAARVWEPSKLYQQAQAKWTSTLSSAAMLEIGYAQYQAYRHTTYEPGVEPPYGSPDWFSHAVHVDTSTGRTWVAAPGGNYYLMPKRQFFSAIASYVTGRHNVRFGAQDNWGFLEQGTILNAALRQTYQNLVPVSVQVYNTPERDRFTENYSWGLFGQDTWKINRASVGVGLRWDTFKSSIAAEEAGAGVFVPDRTFGPQEMPVWKNWSPRLSATYDLRGDAKTALKFSANKYVLSATNGVAAALNPMRLQSSSLSWTDLNGDDVAQGAKGCTYLTAGCEINFAQLPTTFGLITPGCTTIYAPGSVGCGTDQVDPNIKRDTEWAYNIGIQHELFPRFAITANYFYTRFYNLRQTNNLLQTPADYTPVQVASPLDGSVVTIYNVSAAKQSAVRNLQTSSDTAKMWNTDFEFGFNARLPHGASIFGGTATDRTLGHAVRHYRRSEQTEFLRRDPRAGFPSIPNSSSRDPRPCRGAFRRVRHSKATNTCSASAPRPPISPAVECGRSRGRPDIRRTARAVHAGCARESEPDSRNIERAVDPARGYALRSDQPARRDRCTVGEGGECDSQAGNRAVQRDQQPGDAHGTFAELPDVVVSAALERSSAAPRPDRPAGEVVNPLTLS